MGLRERDRHSEAALADSHLSCFQDLLFCLCGSLVFYTFRFLTFFGVCLFNFIVLWFLFPAYWLFALCFCCSLSSFSFLFFCSFYFLDCCAVLCSYLSFWIFAVLCFYFAFALYFCCFFLFLFVLLFLYFFFLLLFPLLLLCFLPSLPFYFLLSFIFYLSVICLSIKHLIKSCE